MRRCVSSKKFGFLASLAAIAFVLPQAAYATETVSYKYDAKGRLVEVKRTGTVNNNVTSMTRLIIVRM
jgi:hypothetical protein